MRAAALALSLLLVATAPASPQHCYHEWRYPWPQHCKVGLGLAKHGEDRPSWAGRGAEAQGKVWTVEITVPPPVKDERTIEQIRDQEEHDAAVAAHKDELNELLRQAREEAAMKAAIGGLK